MYKFFISDIDGTLLNDNKELTKKNVKALKNIYDSGHKLCLATGGGMERLDKIIAEIDRPLSIVCHNGARIYSDDKKLIYKGDFLKSQMAKIMNNIIRECVALYYFCGDDGIFYDRMKLIDDNYKKYIINNNREDILKLGNNLNNYLMTDVFKFNCYKFWIYDADVKKIDKIKYYLGYDNLEMYTSCNGKFLDINAPGVTKYNGIKKVLDYYKTSFNECVIVGDGLNDIEMIRDAGLGICVNNGYDEVKAVAKVTLPVTNNDNSIYYILRNVLK